MPVVDAPQLKRIHSNKPGVKPDALNTPSAQGLCTLPTML